MASGQLHFTANVIAGTVLTSIAYLRAPEPAMALYIGIGCLIGTIVTPDMDLEGTTYTERMMRKIPVFGWLWQQSWYGYALLFRHRGASHNLLLGTPSRIMWLGIIAVFWTVFLIGLLCVVQPGNDPDVLGRDIATTILSWVHPGLLLGWFAQDIAHYILDI
jgi:uncharacterized metal-binding protein